MHVGRGYCMQCYKRLPEFRDKIRNRNRKRQRISKDKIYLSFKKWSKNNRFKRNAHRKLSYEIKIGRVIRMPCEICGNKKSHGHHEDYSKPLDVIWLCSIHHGERHRKVI